MYHEVYSNTKGAEKIQQLRKVKNNLKQGNVSTRDLELVVKTLIEIIHKEGEE